MAYVKTGTYKLREVLTPIDKRAIEIMFFGPYIPEWKNEKGIVDNSDPTIAKRIGVEWAAVTTYTAALTRRHFKKVEKLRRLKEYELPNHLKTPY